MNALYTILLLLASNVFMTLAWYGHLKLQNMGFFTNATPLIFVILLSWGIVLGCGVSYATEVEPLRGVPVPDWRSIFRFRIQMTQGN